MYILSVSIVPLIPPSNKFPLSCLGSLWEERKDRKSSAILDGDCESGVGRMLQMATKASLVWTNLNSGKMKAPRREWKGEVDSLTRRLINIGQDPFVGLLFEMATEATSWSSYLLPEVSFRSTGGFLETLTSVITSSLSWELRMNSLRPYYMWNIA